MDPQTCPSGFVAPLNWVWVGVAILTGAGAFLYWALDFYLLEALLGTSKVEVEWDRDSPITKLAAKHCKSLTRGRYRSPFLLCSPHLETVYLAIERGPKVTYKREVVIQKDGGSVGLDFAGAEKPNAPIVIITPGLTSDSTPPYVRYLVSAVVKQGWRAVVINHRGLGGVTLTSEATHHAGWTTDIREVVALLQKRFPAAPLAVAGCSLGANMTMRYLGEEGDKTPVKAAFTVGSPYDMLIVDRFCNRKFIQKSWIRLMVDGQKEYARQNWDSFSKVIDRKSFEALRNVHEFDDRVVRVASKFETVDAYYRQSSCAPLVTNIRTPLLTVSALDDPICTQEAIPRAECHLNPNVVLATAARGGHLAIYEGWLPRQLWWTQPCVEFLGAIFETQG